MPLIHILLAILVAISWGLNFVISKLCMTTISPLLLATFRFLLTSIPVVFFIKRPAIKNRTILLYGFTMFAIPTVFMFSGIHAGVTAGIASLLMQLQSLLSVVFGIFFFKEKLHKLQILGISCALLGLMLIGANLDGSITLEGCVLIILAATSLAIGNIVAKKYLGNVDVFKLVVWGSFFTWPFLAAITCYKEGLSSVITSINNLTLIPTLAILIIAYIGTLFSFGTWHFLLHKHPIVNVAPFTLLVPLVGFICSRLLLNESFELWKLGALLLVGSGLAINIINVRYRRRVLLGKIND